MKRGLRASCNFLEDYCSSIDNLIFYDYNLDDLDNKNIEEYHAMTKEHTEILG